MRGLGTVALVAGIAVLGLAALVDALVGREAAETAATSTEET